MAAEPWANHVPTSATPVTAVPLAYDRLLMQNIPVLKQVVTTASGGTTVSLPTAFTALIASADEYEVQITKKTVAPNAGEPYPSDKTTSSFKVRLTDETTPIQVFVLVWWMPAA